MAAVVIRGGGCSFGDKALVAQELGASALIVVNNVPGAEPMMADPAFKITLPSIMIPHNAKEIFDGLVKDGCSPAGGILARIRYRHVFAQDDDDL